MVIVFVVALLCYLFFMLNNMRTSIYDFKNIITKSYDEYKIYYYIDKYFSKREYRRWLKKHNKIDSYLKVCDQYDSHLRRFEKLPFVFKPLTSRLIQYFRLDQEFHNKICYLSNVIQNGEEILKSRNQNYIERELDIYKEFFDTIGPDCLTFEQRRTIVTDEAFNLVVAGAGTGKTSTLIGKTGYLIKKGLVDPDSLLLLSFARAPRKKLQDETKNRLRVNLEVRTFHSLGLEILRKTLDFRPRISALSENAAVLQKNIEIFLQNRMIDIDFANKLNEYFLFHLNPVENLFEFQSDEEYEKYIKEIEIRTLNGEIVKSYAECEIANYFFINGIRYEYEKPYIFDTSSEEHLQYRPDFYIPDFDVWIEHIGIDRNCQTAPGIDRWKYLNDWYWKRKTHRENGTRLIETYTYEKQEGTLLSNLETNLKSYEIKFEKIPYEKIFTKLKSLGEVSLFSGLLTKFLNLYKSNTLPISELKNKAKKYPYWQRYIAFLNIFENVLTDYENVLRENSEIDFHDMISLAVEQVNQHNYDSRFRYVLVDEFQDISQSRYKLLKALLDQNEDNKLFCVGDDWQSIYRFTGSDLSIMTDFDKYFEPNEKMFLTKTFRFNDKIRDVSSSFIMKNPEQYEKKLVAPSVKHPGVSIVWYDELERALVDTLTFINSLENEIVDVKVIGRYNRRFYPELRKIDSYFRGEIVQYTTAHKSKGSEADYVIIIRVKSDRYGFPCEIEDDPVLRLVLSEEDLYPNAEERRVFYVAMTRAKKQVFILADRNQVSKFVEEITHDNPAISIIGDPPFFIECPECKKGSITGAIQKGKSVFSCNRYPVCKYVANMCPSCKNGFLYPDSEIKSQYKCSNNDCSFTARICPRCFYGYLQIREKDGKFWGCSNYWSKDCRYTEPIYE